MVHCSKNKILELVNEHSVLFSKHAKERLVQRGIDTDDIIHVITYGNIVKDYSDDKPCPSYLMLGNSKSKTSICGYCLLS